MSSHHRRPVPLAPALLAMALVFTSVTGIVAQSSSNEYFQRVWERTDYPVQAGEATRTWMWGPAVSGVMIQEYIEEYLESPDGERTVQYFDKSRMEITQPQGAANSLWYVTNGLLVVEMIEGQMQVGDDTFRDRLPAQVNVAGDANDPNGPTYATFRALLELVEDRGSALVIQRIDRDGNVSDDPLLELRASTPPSSTMPPVTILPDRSGRS